MRHDVDSLACPPGSTTCPGFLATQYLRPLDPNKPDTTEGSFGGEFDYHVQANLPVFHHGMRKLSQSPFVTSFNVETWIPNVDNRIHPWIWFPNTQCTSVADPACADSQNKTFPFFADNVLLPRGLDVTFSLQLRRGGPLGPAHRTTITETVATAHYVSSPDLHIVPVHFYVFANTSGVNHLRTFVLDGTEKRASALALRAQTMFDLGRIVDKGAGVATGDNEFAISHHSALVQGVKDYRPGEIDFAFARCGNVRLRLATFNIIRQSEGVEEHLPLLADLAGSCHSSGDNGHFDRDSQGVIINPGMRIVDEILRSATQQKAPEVCSATPELCPPVGIHVFLTGFFQNRTGGVEGTGGVGCKSGVGAAYAMVEDSTEIFSEEIFSVMTHELGHVFGLSEDPTKRFEDTVMVGQPWPETDSDRSACDEIRRRAQDYEQDFSLYPTQ